MGKISGKKYEAICQARAVIAQLCNDGALDTIEDSVDVVQNTCLMKIPALFKEALITVFVSGTITDYGFRIPAVESCCENFAIVCKKMKRHSLRLFIHDPFDKRADEDGYFTSTIFGYEFMEK